MKILFVEDSEADVELIQRLLQKEKMTCESRTVETRDEFKEALLQFSPDVILADHSLPNFNSLEALEIVKSLHLKIPFILVTGTVSEEFAVECIKKGADDYILKNKLSRLPIAIQQAIDKHRIEKERDKIAYELLQTNDELRSFISSVTENLKGPLAAIVELPELAMTDAGKLEEYLSLNAQAAKKLNNTFNELSEILSLKDMNVVAAEVNLHNVTEQVLNDIETEERFPRTSFSIDVSFDQGFSSDEQILTSVLKNTVKYILRHQKESTEDTSIGIKAMGTPAGMQLEITGSFVFDNDFQEKFFRLDFDPNTDTREGEFSLYLIKIGVEKLHGTIRLRRHQKRSTFVIELPPIQNSFFTIEDLYRITTML